MLGDAKDNETDGRGHEVEQIIPPELVLGDKPGNRPQEYSDSSYDSKGYHRSEKGVILGWCITALNRCNVKSRQSLPDRA